MSDYYLMNDDGTVRPCSMKEWGRMFEDGPARRVAYTKVKVGLGAEVSTVFLGLDHRFGGDGPPLVFETMVFPSKGNYHEEAYCGRHSTRHAALECHERIVEITANLLREGVVLDYDAYDAAGGFDGPG